MENITGTRRGRPRKSAQLPVDAEQAKSASNDNIRDRETSGTGITSPAESNGTSQGLSYLGLIDLVKSKNSHSYRISCVIHPEADGVVITDNMGNIRTEKGECAYQLNTGEVIKI